MKMRKLIIMATLFLATPALAEELTMETTMGNTLAEVQTKLIEMGYEVRKSEMEDGEFEVYFVKGNKMGEVYVDATTGKITKLIVK
jgi:Peptidase propeptide and YPEB domain